MRSRGPSRATDLQRGYRPATVALPVDPHRAVVLPEAHRLDRAHVHELGVERFAGRTCDARCATHGRRSATYGCRSAARRAPKCCATARRSPARRTGAEVQRDGRAEVRRNGRRSASRRRSAAQRTAPKCGATSAGVQRRAPSYAPRGARRSRAARSRALWIRPARACWTLRPRPRGHSGLAGDARVLDACVHAHAGTADLPATRA